jgi:predicted phage terminase large subunit-like protein
MPAADLLRETATPALFAMQASRGWWHPAPHLMELDRAVIDTIIGRNASRRLIVTMPPRHGKSEYVSSYTPAWYLGTFPDRRVMLGSYESNFASKWGRQARNILEELGWVFGVSICKDASAKNSWEIDGHRGGMQTAGVGGPFTGRGGDLVIIDDPIKNAQEAASLTMRDNLWEWWKSTVRTRLEPNAAIVIMHTRWNEDDLVGRLIMDAVDDGTPWHCLNFPAIANDFDCLGRKPGDALWPERYPIEALLRTKRDVGSYYWSAMYQQTPVPDAGNIFPREQLIGNTVTPVELRDRTGIQLIDLFRKGRACRYWDKAGTEDHGNYSAGVLMVEYQKFIIVMDVTRGQWSALRREQIIEASARNDRSQFAMLPELVVEQEPGSGGKESAEATVRRLMGFNVRADKVTGEQMSRCRPYAAQVEGGNVYLLKTNRPEWISKYIDELTAYPNGQFDDQVTASSGAFNHLNVGIFDMKFTPKAAEHTALRPQDRGLKVDKVLRDQPGPGRYGIQLDKH